MQSTHESISSILSQPTLNSALKAIGEKVMRHERISSEEALVLFEQG